MRTIAAIVLGHLAVGVALAAPAPVHIVVSGRGEIALLVPSGWAQSRDSGAPGGVPTLSLAPQSGPTFSVMVTVFPAGEHEGAMDPTPIRAFVGEAAKEAQSQAVEKKLLVRELPDSGGRGFYITATDRAPAPGEWKYLTQGAVGIGGAMLVFTILTNDGQEAVSAAALDMVRRARFQLPATST